MSKVINIYLEANPNPNSLKFVTDKMLIDDGIVKDYPDIKSASESPIAQALFNFSFIKRVFIMSNFITLTKDENTTWDDIKMELRDFIKKYIEEDKIIINKEIKNENQRTYCGCR